MRNILPKNRSKKSKLDKEKEIKKAYFCVPADFNTKNLKSFSELNLKYKNAKIEEVYGSLPQSIYGSGRSSASIFDVDFKVLKKYVAACKKNGIEFNYTFNANTLSNREFNKKSRREILSFIKKLYSLGIRRFTVTMPSLISLIQNNFKDAEIVLSVINGITTPYQLKELSEAGKIIRAYVAEDMNRKPSALKKVVAKSKVPIATILNTFCLFECAYRAHHYNFMAFRDKTDNIDMVEYYGARCAEKKVKNANEIIKIPWIRPNDIKNYLDMGVCWFKIAGREMVKAGPDFPRAIEVYMAGEYKGDLIDLFNNFSDKHYNRIFSLDSDSLNPYFNYIFNKKVDCSRELCDGCGMCKKYSKFVKINKKEIKLLPEFKLLK